MMRRALAAAAAGAPRDHFASTPAAVTSTAGHHNVGYPVGIDTDLAIWKRYAIRTPPAVVLVSRGGRLLRGRPRPVEGALAQVVRER